MLGLLQVKTFRWLVMVLAISLAAGSLNAQDDLGLQAAFGACNGAASGTVCFGNGDVEGADLSAAGDIADLDAVETLTVNSGVALLRLPAGLDATTGDFLTMALIGEAELTNALPAKSDFPVCVAASQNAGSISIYSQPNTSSAIMSSLAPTVKVQANGRFDGTTWYRILVGDRLGWILNENIAIDCEPATLAEVDRDDVAVLYNTSMQTVTLVSGDDVAGIASGLLLRAPTNARARLLINGVQVYLSGSAFATGDGAGITLTVLEGRAEVIAERTSEIAQQGQIIVAAPDAPPGTPENTDPGGLNDLLNSVIYGQPYAGAGSTISGLSVDAVGTGTDGSLVRVNLAFTGNAALCSAAPDPVSVIFVADISPALSAAGIDAMRTAMATGAQALDITTDNYGVVVFRGQGLAAQKLRSDFVAADYETAYNATVGKLVSADASLVSDFSAGLSTAISLLKGAPTGRRAIVFISDGTSDAEALEPLVAEARNQDIEIVTIALGSSADAELLASMADEDALALQSPDLSGLPAMTEQASLMLRRGVAAANFALSYQVNDDAYEIASEDLITTFGGTVDGNTVTWEFSAIYDTQRVIMPLVLRATDDTTDVPGTLTVEYEACGDAPVSSDELAAPLIAEAGAGNVTARQGVMALGDVGSGNIAPFNQVNWLVDSSRAPIFSVVTSGANAGLNTLLTNSDVAPLYTLTNFDGNNRNLTVFRVPEGGLYWLTLQSTSTQAAGLYEISPTDATFDDALAALEPGGDPIPDQQVNGEGRVYALDNVADGDVVTFRYTGGAPAFPLQIVSLDGSDALEVFTRFDDTRGEWYSVQALRGAGPYRVIAKSDGAYEILVQSGDTISDDRGELILGERVAQRLANDVPVPVKYTLVLDDDETVTFNMAGGTTPTTLRDSDNQLIRPLERFAVNRFNLDRYELAAGEYTVYMTVAGDYSITLVAGQIEPSLKGVANIGAAVQGRPSANAPLSVYNILAGAGKPLFEGDEVTIFLTDTVANNRSVLVENANGEAAEAVNEFVDGQNERFVGVYRLVGAGPFRVITVGMQENHVFTVQRGDLLTSNKGAIIVGQTVRDSSNAPTNLTYTLAPEFGKNLGEGDLVTIGFSNQGADEDPFFPPTLQDGKASAVQPLRLVQFGRQFVGVYELRGVAPFQLVIPNVGSYNLSFRIGDTMVLSQGDIAIDTDVRGVTRGPQRVEYMLDGAAGDAFTIKIASVSGDVTAFDMFRTVNVSNALNGGSAFTDDFTVTSVFTLTDDGPQVLSFALTGEYLVNVKRGDDLNKSGGTFFLGDAETANSRDLKIEGKRLSYDLNITEPNQVLTIQNTESYFLVNPQGVFVPETYFMYAFVNRSYQGLRQVYQLQDPGVYRLIMFPFDTYTLRVAPEDLLTVYKGNVFYDITETDKLKDDERFATYTLNANAGDTVTVRLEMDRLAQSRIFLEPETVAIFDARGIPQTERRTIRNDGYLLVVYDLRGAGPYTLQVQPQRRTTGEEAFTNDFGLAQEAYRLTVYGRDVSYIYAIEELTLDTEFEGEWPAVDGRRTIVHYFQNEKNDPRTITIDLEADLLRYSGTLRVVGPSGNVPIDSVGTLQALNFVNNKLTRYTFTLPEAGTYELHFDGVGKYKYKIVEGDQQTVNFGKVEVNPRNPEPVFVTDNQGNQKPVAYEPIVAENKFNQTQIIGSYQFESPVGSQVSVWLDARNLASDPTLVSADGVPIFPIDVGSAGNTLVYVYQLEGAPPYHFNFQAAANGQHKVRVDEGNSLIADLPELFLNPNNPEPVVTVDARGNEKVEPYEPIAVEVKLEAPAVTGRHLIPAGKNSIITLQLEQSGNNPPQYLVVDGNGEPVIEFAAVPDRGTIVTTLQLVGPTPHTLLVNPARGDYKVTLTDGNILVADAGSLPIGLLEEDYANELPEPARIALHTLNVDAGQFVTIQLTNGRNFVPLAVVDADGAPVEAALFDFQGSTNVYTYLLTGVAPYTVTFPVIGEYEVVVQVGNLVRVDRGLLQYAVATEGELEDPGKVVTFTIEGKRDQLITLQSQDKNRPVNVELRDANGKLWEPIAQVVQNNALYTLYVLGGPSPYTVTFPTEEYAVTVRDGNVLRSLMGPVVLGEAVKSKLEPPALTAVYDIPADPGEVITVRLQSDGRAYTPRVYNGDGQQLVPLAESVQSNALFSIFSLSGSGPYQVEFESTRNYDLTVSDGNLLLADLGDIPIGERVAATLKAPQQIALYRFNGTNNEIFSIALQVGGRAADIQLADADGNLLEPQTVVDKNNTKFAVYTLNGVQPYSLVFFAPRNYTVTVSRGNVLRADLGLIRFGNTITDRLTEAEQAAFFLVDANPGDTITLRLADGNKPLIGELTNSDGDVLLPWAQASTTNASYSTFTVSGTPPYLFTFIPKSNYSVTLEEGNAFRSEQGIAPFGQNIRNRLDQPVQIASYKLYTASDQVISIQLTNSRAGYMVPRLLNAEGEEIIPQTRVFNGNSVFIGVYTLEGDAPYTIEFEIEPRVDYTLRLARGDASIVDVEEVGPQSDEQNRLPGQRERRQPR